MAGIACAGNWILDRVKIVDRWPRKGELANIIDETLGPGGSPFNILAGFARMGAPFPASGFGCIGSDDNGRQVLSMCGQYGIDGTRLHKLPDIATSYTDVMSVQKTGERTFFHFRGANARFSPAHVPLEALRDKGVKILHLAYLLLLDAMDAPDPDCGTVAARFLREAQNAGLETSADLVSDAPARFKKIAGPALPYIDHLILNELEAERITGVAIRKAKGYHAAGLKKAARALLKKGVKKNAVIHLPEGVFWAGRGGTELFVPSLKIPREHFVGATGAGDALCAGVLLGLHEGWPAREALEIGVGAAAACIGAANTVDGLRPLEEIRRLCREWR